MVVLRADRKIEEPGGRIEQSGLDVGGEGLAAIDGRVPRGEMEAAEALEREVHQGIVVSPQVEGDVDYAERRKVFDEEEVGEG